MKKLILILVVAMVAMTSCKNTNKQVEPEPSQEQIDAMKVELSEDVMAKIDEYAQKYIDSHKDVRTIFSHTFDVMTESQKMVKPDYLLDLSTVDNLMTKSQKTAALAIILCEIEFRKAYDMPVEEAKEAAAKLMVELNHPTQLEDYRDLTVSEKIKREYETCKENGDIYYFWQFEAALVTEVQYLIAQNPKQFFGNITEEQYALYAEQINILLNACTELAPYDSEIAYVLNNGFKGAVILPLGQIPEPVSTAEKAIQFYNANYADFVDSRNSLLK